MRILYDLVLWTLLINLVYRCLLSTPSTLVLLSNAVALSGFFFAVALLRRKFSGQLFKRALDVAGASYLTNLGLFYVIIGGTLDFLSQGEYLWALFLLVSAISLGFIMPYDLAKHIVSRENPRPSN